MENFLCLSFPSSPKNLPTGFPNCQQAELMDVFVNLPKSLLKKLIKTGTIVMEDCYLSMKITYFAINTIKINITKKRGKVNGKDE